MGSLFPGGVASEVEFLTRISNVSFDGGLVELEAVDAKISIGAVTISKGSSLGWIFSEEVVIGIVAIKDAERWLSVEKNGFSIFGGGGWQNCRRSFWLGIIG